MKGGPGPSREYSCSVAGCGKTFTRRDYLERHAVNHSLEKPFVCPKCGRGYARADVLKRHIADHPRERASGPKLLLPGPKQAESNNIESDQVLSSVFDPYYVSGAPDTLDNLFTWYTNYEESTGVEDSLDSLFGISDMSAVKRTPSPSASVSASIVNTETWQACTYLVARLCLQAPGSGWSEGDVTRYVELYFLHFHAMYPILHRPTLTIRGIRPHLLIAIACLGSAASTINKVDREFLGQLQLSLKFHLFSLLAGPAKADLDVLQALFLINYFGNNYCSEELAKTGQMFHSAGVTAARNAGVFNTPEQGTPSLERVNRNNWLQWATEQERIRLAWMIFTEDCFSSGVLRHSIMLQCFSVTVPLPCEESIWTAASSESWQKVKLRCGPDVFYFRPGLRQLLATGELPEALNTPTLWILVHALLTLTWALSNQGPDMFTLARRAQITMWKSSVSFALVQWQNAFRANVPFGGERLPHHMSGMAISQLSSLLLLTDLDSVRILAGAQNLNGRDIQDRDRVASRQLLDAWAQSAEGRQSCWIAIDCLRTAYGAIGSRDSGRPCPRTLWCIYISTITIWVYTALIEERFINPRTYIPLAPDTYCRIEADLARRSAQEYLDRVHDCDNPINLPEVSDLDSCTALVAYAAHLCGEEKWGSLAAPTRVLYGLLKFAESAVQPGFASC